MQQHLKFENQIVASLIRELGSAQAGIPPRRHVAFFPLVPARERSFREDS